MPSRQYEYVQCGTVAETYKVLVLVQVCILPYHGRLAARFYDI